MIGTVKGHEIGKNLDGDRDVVLLQVQLSDIEDVQTVELYSQSGMDFIPPLESTVIVTELRNNWKIGIATKDIIMPVATGGEYEIYSSDSGAKKARIKLKTNGLVLFKNDVEDLKTLMNDLITEIKNIITTGSPTTHTVAAASKILLDDINTRFNSLLGA